jgi:hypothetical protein
LVQEVSAMKASSAVLLALAGLLLVAGAAGASINSGQGQGRVYTVAQIVARQADDPRAWANQQVLVRGIGGGCIPWAAPKGSPCVDEQPELAEMRADTLVAALPLVCGQLYSLPRLVRELPWLGHVLASPQVLYPGKLTVYRIQLPRIPGYDALLLDSLPSCGDE